MLRFCCKGHTMPYAPIKHTHTTLDFVLLWWSLMAWQPCIMCKNYLHLLWSRTCVWICNCWSSVLFHSYLCQSWGSCPQHKQTEVEIKPVFTVLWLHHITIFSLSVTGQEEWVFPTGSEVICGVWTRSDKIHSWALHTTCFCILTLLVCGRFMHEGKRHEGQTIQRWYVQLPLDRELTDVTSICHFKWAERYTYWTLQLHFCRYTESQLLRMDHSSQFQHHFDLCR